MKQRYQRIAEDYLHAHEAGQTTLVVSPSNDERRNLNQEISALLVARGQVEKQGSRTPHSRAAGFHPRPNHVVRQLPGG